VFFFFFFFFVFFFFCFLTLRVTVGGWLIRPVVAEDVVGRQRGPGEFARLPGWARRVSTVLGAAGSAIWRGLHDRAVRIALAPRVTSK